MTLPDGSLEIAYCANPGSMNGCLQTGSEVLLWDSGDDKRKRRYTWRAIKLKSVWVGTDTHLANHLVAELVHRHVWRQLLFPVSDNYIFRPTTTIFDGTARPARADAVPLT